MTAARTATVELERGTPTSRHIRPELLLWFGMVFPERSQVLRAYYQDSDDRRRRRAGEFEDELLDAAHCSPEEIIERILADERAGGVVRARGPGGTPCR